MQYAQLMVADEYQRSGCKQRWISEFSYAAKSWGHERRVITRLKWGSKGCNPRFVVTNLDDPPEALYERLRCHRGEAETSTRWPIAAPGFPRCCLSRFLRARDRCHACFGR